MDYTCQELEIYIKKKSKDNYLVQVVDSKGKVRGEKEFVLEMDKLKMREDLKRLEELAVTSKRVEDEFHIDFGKHIFNLILGDETKKHYNECMNKSQPVRIRIRVDESAKELQNIPWEFLHDGEDFLVTQADTLVSRLPLNVEKKVKGKLDQAISMLVVISNPLNLPDRMVLDTEKEQEVIIKALDNLQRQRKLDIDFVDEASTETINDYLSEKQYHIIHFTGHGVFDEDEDKGFLLLQDREGKMRNVENDEIATVLQNHKSLRLVVLSACQSAKASNNTGYPDLSRTLVGKGIPVVLSMQHSVLDRSAIDFAGRFYGSLAAGKPLDFALSDARRALYVGEDKNRVDFATPVLFLNDPDSINVADIKVTEETVQVKQKPFLAGEVAVMEHGFVGRRRELRAIGEEFVSGRKRAFIIHGFGGIGKSVLATRAALKMQDHFDGVRAIRVKPTTKPEDILNDLNGFLMLAGKHDFNKVIHEKIPTRTKTDLLTQILNQIRLLIIFDNFEDVLTKETERKISDPPLSEFFGILLNGVFKNTKMIFTTRYDFDPLDGRLCGHIGKISLPELSFPFMVFLMNNFEELKKLPVEKKLQIYKKIGGHPYMLGIFSKHARATSVDQLLSDLAPVTKEMMEFTLLDMTYSKLSDRAKTLLRRISVFEEAVPLEALQWMMGDDKNRTPDIGEELDALEGWGLLVKKEEFVGKGQKEMYAVHQLVRDFASGRLQEEKGETRKAYLIKAGKFYQMLAETSNDLGDLLTSREYFYKAEEFDTAWGIIQEVHEYLVRWGHVELVIRLLKQSADSLDGSEKAVALGSLANMYYRLGDYRTALKGHEQVKVIFEKLGDKSRAAIALHQLGMIHQNQGNYEEAIEKFEQSLMAFRELGEKGHAAAVLHNLGTIHQDQGNYKEAVKKYEESLKIDEELGNRSGIAYSLGQLGTVHYLQGEYTQAQEKYEKVLGLSIELGDKSGIAITLHQLGMIHYNQGNYKEAVKKYEESLKTFQQLGEKGHVAAVLHNLGIIHQNQGNYKESVKKYEQSLKIKQELGDKSGIARTLHQLAMIHQDQCNYKEAVKKYEQSLKIKEELGDKHGIASTVHQLGIINEEQEHYEEAMRKYLVALPMLRGLGLPDAEITAGSLARLREKMGEKEFKKAWKELTGEDLDDKKKPKRRKK